MSIRLEKISSLLKEEISLILLHKVKDPELGFVTITNIKVTPDTKIARIYISVLEREKRDKVLQKIKSITGLIKGELGRRLKMRTIPDLEFYIDDTLDYVEKMDELFKKINQNDKQEE